MKHEMTLFHKLFCSRYTFFFVTRYGLMWSSLNITYDAGPFESPLLPRIPLYLVMDLVKKLLSRFFG